MWGAEPQLELVRERFKLLLNTHRVELKPQRIVLQKGKLLIKQGEHAENCYLIVQGKVAIQLKNEDQPLHTLAVVEAEEFLGELALFGQGTHTCDVRVVDGPAEFLQFRGEDLIKIMIFDSELVIELLALSSQRCHKSNDLIGLLLDGITALHSEDTISLKRVCEKLLLMNHSFAKATSKLHEIHEN